MTRTGLLISIEGVDTAGKSTQAALLKTYFEEIGQTAVVLHFPDYDTPFGAVVKEHYLMNAENCTPCEAQAYQMVMIAGMRAKMGNIAELLHQGVNVIVDRYVLSTIVYAIADFVSRLEIELTSTLVIAMRDTILDYQKELITPDLTFILQLSHDEIVQRKQHLDHLESNLRMMEAVTALFTTHASDLTTDNRTILAIDAEQTADDIHEALVVGIDDYYHEHIITSNK